METLSDHAEAWTIEQGGTVPPKDTPEYLEMYEKWVNWAFQDLDDGTGKKRKKKKNE
jgi:hypothetical protein